MEYPALKKNCDGFSQKKNHVHITAKNISISHRLNKQNNSPSIIAKFLNRKLETKY